MEPEYYVYLYEKLDGLDFENNEPYDPFHFLYNEDEQFHNWIKNYDEEVEKTLDGEETKIYW